MSLAFISDRDHLQTALDFWRQGDLTGAAEHFEQALVANPDDADVLAWMAESLRREGEYANAANYVWSVYLEDRETAKSSLQAMDESGLWPDSIEALALWMLQSAPQGRSSCSMETATPILSGPCRNAESGQRC